MIGVGALVILIALLVIVFVGLYIFFNSDSNQFEIVGQSGGGRCYYYQPTEEEKLRIQMERQEEQDVTELASSEKELEYLKIKKELKELKKEIRKINIMSYPSKTEKFGSCVPENFQKAMIKSAKRYEKKYWEEQQRLQI